MQNTPVRKAVFLSCNSQGFPCFDGRQRQRGVALVFVLANLVILTLLVVAFLLGAGRERKTAASYQATATTQGLVDVAVNLVEAQITAATTATTDGVNNAWASQPGAIWTWNQTGAISKVYRLYSWDSMTTANSAFVADDVGQMANWTASPAVWVDLNAPGPGILSSGNADYPILDPNVSVDGFSIDASTKPTGTAPMPVKWMYMLQDGQVSVPVGSGSTVTIAGASPSNPIVGRIAYWTDDETCKVNVNTAGGDDGGGTPPSISNGVSNSAANAASATFWDTPHFSSTDDSDLGKYQPAAGEYQRFPGHPATIALSPLLRSIMGQSLTPEQYYSLTPRYSYGGSKEGTIPVGTGVSIPLKADRLYASLEELLFSGTNRTPSTINSVSQSSSRKIKGASFFLTPYSRAPELNLFGKPRVSMWPVYNTGQPLTASSPVPTQSGSPMTNLTPTDQLLAFCSTIVSASSVYPYYFTRANANRGDTAQDISLTRNNTLLNYLDTLTSAATPIPGFGGSFGTKYGTAGTHQILTEIFDYIRTINSQDPNLPKPAGAAYPANVYAAGTKGSGDVLLPDASSPSGTGGGIVSVGYGQITPSTHPTWGTQGIGSFPMLVEADLQFVAMGKGQVGSTPAVPLLSGTQPGNTSGLMISGTTPPAGTTAVQAFLLLNFLNPAHCFEWQHSIPFFWVKATGLEQFKLHTYDGKDTSLGFPASATTVGCAYKWDNLLKGPSLMMGYMDFRALIAQRTLGQGSTQKYPFYSTILPVSGNNMVFTGGTITLQISAPEKIDFSSNTFPSIPTASSRTFTYTLYFPPSSSFPVPSVPAKYRSIGFLSSGTATANNNPNADRWLDLYTGNNPGYYIDGANDVVVGLVLNHPSNPNRTSSTDWSDARLLARTSVPKEAFAPHPSYYSGSRAAYGVNIPGAIGQTPGATTGKLVENANYSATTQPAVPPPANGVKGNTSSGGTFSPGDWDNGVANYPDGPYINKTDEGNQVTTSDFGPYYSWTPSSNTAALGVYFSPNRQVPSPGVFGSLPTGIDPNGNNPKAWQTLLFRPGPTGHPGTDSPKDHLLLDLFWMPLAEPYAISEPFSTAGKINLNYEIVPFTYITRSTAIRAVLAGEKIAAISSAYASKYKTPPSGNDMRLNTSDMPHFTTRYSINLGGDSGDDGGTLQQFRNLFTGQGAFAPSATPSIFKSGTQICDIYLVPSGTSWTTPNIAGGTSGNGWYGDQFAMIGDNVRERPYATIYGKVTTKSNTYTVHYTVQSLKASPSDLAAGQWTENKGAVTGEYRGSTTIERYIDAASASIADNASDSTAPNLESHYRWHVITNHQFVP